jgi:hypothetical protein
MHLSCNTKTLETPMKRLLTFAPLFALACNDVNDPDPVEENEVITTIVLTFTPTAGDALEFRWSDPENDGSPVIDDIALSDADDYALTVAFLNELEEPAEDLTAEIADEAEEHQVFFTGSAVAGPASDSDGAVITHAYADEDAGGLPVGLDNTITTDAVGEGTLFVTLRHLPEEGGAVVKVDGLAETVRDEGFGAIGGDNDAQVEFPIAVE